MFTSATSRRAARRRWRRFVLLAVATAGWPLSATPSSAGPEEWPALVAAGDVAECEEGTGGDEATGDLIEAMPEAAVAVLGDVSQGRGAPGEYTSCYEEAWGAFKGRTRPAPGNHDYDTGGGAGYHGYFGAAAGDPTQGWYSYDVGAWHVVAVNSNCDDVGGCGTGSPQERWLRADLAAHPADCVVAYWHHPRFSSPARRPTDSRKSGTDDPKMRAIWQALHDHGADVVLNGHRAVYERFARQDNEARPDPRGIRQFIAGTGGASVNYFEDEIAPNSEVRQDALGGVLRLTLRPDGFDWRFLPAGGHSFTDAGSDTCTPAVQNPPPAPPPSPAAQAAAVIFACETEVW